MLNSEVVEKNRFVGEVILQISDMRYQSAFTSEHYFYFIYLFIIHETDAQ